MIATYNEAFHSLMKAQKFANSDMRWQLDSHRRVEMFLEDNLSVYFWEKNIQTTVFNSAGDIKDAFTLINEVNLPKRDCWWHLERVLGTVNPETREPDGSTINFISMGWRDNKFGFTAWMEVPSVSVPAIPIFTATVKPGDENIHVYLPSVVAGMAEDRALHVASQLLRMILAGAAWMSQKIVVTDEHPLPRSFRRHSNLTVNTVRVIRLRRSEHKPTNGESEVEWSHRWLVNGHWRNQPYGPGKMERKLIWISPYVKGPDDKPFVPKTDIYRVDR